jgi:acyl-CoA synthetase (AMP-forming)/AMP-acid ligase II
MGGKTLGALALETTARRGDAWLVLAAKDADFRWSHTQLMAEARCIAAGMTALGIGRHDVVAVQLPPSLEVVVAHAACALIGATLLPIVHIYGGHELAFMLRESGAKMLISGENSKEGSLRQLVAKMAELPRLLHHVIVGAEDGFLHWRQLRKTAECGYVDTARSSDVAALIYTSGTTSEPKGVQHSHTSIAAELRFGIGDFVGPDDAMLCPWPLGHIAGYLMVARFWALGFHTVLMEQWDGACAARLIEQYQVVLTQGTPYHLTSLLDAAESTGRNLTSVKEYVAGATMISPSLVSRSQAAGLGTLRSFGLTEIPTATRGSRLDSLEKRMHTDGRACPGVEIRIVDDTDHDVPHGVPGEVILRGPEQFVGYRRAELNRDVFLAEGWMRTGDIGLMDADGFLCITDRKKDIIIRGGENISSREVEELIAAMPGVKEVAAVGAPDERLGERVCVFVALYENATLSIPDVDRFFRSRGVARQKTPEQLVIVADFPRTPSGKIKKPDLRRQLHTL